MFSLSQSLFEVHIVGFRRSKIVEFISQNSAKDTSVRHWPVRHWSVLQFPVLQYQRSRAIATFIVYSITVTLFAIQLPLNVGTHYPSSRAMNIFTGRAWTYSRAVNTAREYGCYFGHSSCKHCHVIKNSACRSRWPIFTIPVFTACEHG